MASQPSAKPVRTHAACTHVTMVRVYSYVLRCDSCDNYGPFGWLYRCSQDREEILRDSIFCGDEVTFDDLGKQLITAVQPRHRGPEKRAGNAASFLEEMPSNHIAKTYTSDQLLTIFHQRKHLGNVLRRESVRKTAATVTESNTYELEEFLDQSANPWVPSLKEECQYKICPYCRPGGADRAYISLDGIADGSIPATAATGFGFHLFRQRPICNSKLVANLGLRSSSTSGASTSSSASYESPSSKTTKDRTDPGLATHLMSQLDLSTLARMAKPISPYPIPHAHIPRSPGIPNLAAQAGRPESTDGDSSLQDSAVASVSLPSTVDDAVVRGVTEMEEHEEKERKFSAQPLEVHSGVAVLEESVGLHVPDLVTQI
nr:uncharacterized protein CTRU02_06393 [Colletotrichum truncatum]KAF6792897.1 hypothetical protein CTRU02_06393 [Colletotrichum truncatum]